MRSAVESLRTEFATSPFRTCFQAEGFPVSGAVSFPLIESEYALHAQRYRHWIENRKHGEMQYLARGLDRRLNPRLVFPGLKTVFTVLKPYSPHPVGDESLRYARYLNGPDYHESMKAGLGRALEAIRNSAGMPRDFDYKICVDTSAVLERTWAELCGLGWIGKNTLLIHPQLGSYVFIGVVFTNLESGFRPKKMKDYCGPCTRCLGACPTEALAPHDLDSRKCISYLTLEKRGPWDQTFDTKGFIAGCDLCQEVCPYNTKAVKYIPDPGVVPELVTDSAILEAETEAQYLDRVRDSALSRIRYADFRRNLAGRRGGS
jgi:epoxyqueuosine reductase